MDHSEFSYGGQPQYPYEPGYQPPKPPKKRKRTGLGGKLVALGLVCGLLGSLVGGLIVAGILGSRPDPELPAVQAEPEGPEGTQPQEERPMTIIETAPANTGAMSPAQVYETYVDAVVGISNEVTSKNVFGQISATASTGSGFILSEDGYIVTNYHVVAGAQSLKVSLYDGTVYEAELIGYEATNDVALLKITADDLTAVAVGDSDELAVGDCVAAIGNPLGELTYTMTVGYVSAMDREINTDGTPINMLQTDAAINSGNSGGPLFDMNGNVVGITTAKYSGSTNSGTTIEGIGFAIPINDVMDLVPDLQAYGRVTGQAYLGVTVRDLDATTAELYQLPLGAYVLTVEAGGCAAEAGVQEGDIITALGGVTVESYTELVAALKEFKAGETVSLEIWRGGQTLELSAVLDERPQTETPNPVPEQIPEEEPAWDAEPFDYFDYFFGN